MTFTPRWRHTTQMHMDGSGWNDCAESSMARAIMEYDPATPARTEAAEWALVRRIHDPADLATIWELINRLSILARGAPDHPGNAFTSGAGIVAALAAFGLDCQYINGAEAGMEAVTATPMLLCWVDGTALAPATFPASYFSGDWGYDHIILSLPAPQLYNDPLSVWPDTRTDAHYSDASMRVALGGVWTLPTPEPVGPALYNVRSQAAGKAHPNHLGPPANSTVETLVAGAVVTLTGQRTPHWVQVTAEDSQVCWLLADNIRAA